MDLGAVMDELATALGTIDALRVYPYWADKVAAPAAIVGFPDSLDYDLTMVRGGDQMTLSLIVVVGRSDARSSRDRLAKYAAGSGADSIKAAVEGHAPVSRRYDSAHVTKAEFGTASIAGVDYLSATFHIDVIGVGA